MVYTLLMLKRTTSLREGMLLEVSVHRSMPRTRIKPYLITISEGSLNGRAATWRITVLDAVQFSPFRIFNDGDKFPDDFILHYINNEGTMRVFSE
jgi:hypothetical protein